MVLLPTCEYRRYEGNRVHETHAMSSLLYLPVDARKFLDVKRVLGEMLVYTGE